MANRFVQAATKELDPIYNQQIKSVEGQVPAIQKLYDTLVSGLQQQNQTQLNQGTQNIVEDASARGVLRSSLPVDARTTLTSQLGAALNQGLGQLGAQRMQDIGQINQQVGNLRLQRSEGINRLADMFRQQDLQERALAEQRRTARAAAAANNSWLRAFNNGNSGGSTNNQQQSLPNFRVNVKGASSSQLKSAFNDVNTRYELFQRGKITDADLRSDYQATASSAKYGNKRDLAKLQWYRGLLPDLFRSAYSWEARGGIPVTTQTGSGDPIRRLSSMQQQRSTLNNMLSPGFLR